MKRKKGLETLKLNVNAENTVRLGLHHCPPSEKYQNNKGITLIALIVTIIVLLILAGVTLSLIGGSDGILGKAEKAVELTNNSSIKEEVELAIIEKMSEYYENSADYAGMYRSALDFVKAEFAESKNYTTSSGAKLVYDEVSGKFIYTKNGKETSMTVDENGNATIDGTEVSTKRTVSYNANGGEGDVPASTRYEIDTEVTVAFSPAPTNGDQEFVGWATSADATTATYTASGTKTFTMGTSNVTLYAVWKKVESLSTQITTDNYGDYVELGTSLIVNDNIALEDGTTPLTDWRIFHKDATGGIYLILADYLPYSYNTTVGSGLLQYSSSYPYNWMSNTSRTDLLTRLAKTSAWNKLISSTYTAKGISVTGALSLETWVASWNAKGYTKLYTARNSTGYYVGTSENPITTAQFLNSDKAGYGNTLYFSHKNYTTISNAYAYWLASPSAESSSRMMDVSCDGDVYYSGYDNYNLGVRPAVYLPSDIQAEKNAEGVWEIK